MIAPPKFMKSMKLYEQVERIHNELRALGIEDHAPLKVSDITPFDQYHYLGTSAVDEAARALRIGPQSRVLEIGSGIGGPARYLAATTGCTVVAVELQSDLHETAVNLTERCGFDGQVRHVCGDILEMSPPGPAFDAILSFLVFLHIPDRERLFGVCRSQLRENGEMFIEDFVLKKQGTDRHLSDLRNKLQCPYLPDAATYEAELKRAGFVIQQFSDMTEPWREFTAKRLHAFRGQRERNVAVHGETITSGLDDFYSTVAALFANGIVGGARIRARLAS